MEIMTMLDCSMGHNAYAQTLVLKEIASKENAIMIAQEMFPWKCVEALAISTYSTLMHTRQPLMTGDVETQRRIASTKNGIPTWAIVASHKDKVLHLPPHQVPHLGPQQ